MSKEINLNDISFEVSMPSIVLLNKKIDDSAKILFGFIKGLTKAHGYCFATNSYLAQLMDSSSESVQRWLRQLKEEGFIEIETEKNGIHWQRHIYVGFDLKKCLRMVNDNTPPFKENTPPLLSVTPIYKEYIKEDIQTNISLPSSKPEPVQKKVDPPNDDGFLRNSFKKAKLDSEQIERAIKFYFKSPKVKEANNPIGFVVSMVRQNKDKEESANEEIIQKRKEWAQKHQSSSCAGYLLALKDGIEKCSGSLFKFFRYDSNDSFWEGIGLGMNNMNLAT